MQNFTREIASTKSGRDLPSIVLTSLENSNTWNEFKDQTQSLQSRKKLDWVEDRLNRMRRIIMRRKHAELP